jgi:arsenate reductase (glutaredoxin)
LPAAAKETLNETGAVALMLEQPTMIKRPVLDVDGQFLVGFKADAYQAAFPKK